VKHKYEQSEASTGDTCVKMVMRTGMGGGPGEDEPYGDQCGLPQALHPIHDPGECAPEECGGTRLDPCAYTVEQWRRMEAREAVGRGLEHDWYHDGFMSIGASGRLCRTCRFREGDLVGLDCFGSSSLYDAAFGRGRSTGAAAERERLRAVLGL